MAILIVETNSNSGPFGVRDLFRAPWLRSLIGALFLLGIAYAFEHFANIYEASYSLRPTSTYVGDLLLDNLPVIDLNFIIIEGALFGIIAGVVYVFSRPRYVLFTLKTVALFIMVRALFVSLTHVGIYPGNISPDVGIFDGIYTYLNFQTGFFFSGHTGLPFLMALIFWEKHRARTIFLGVSAIFGVAVLLSHIHYSIDVFAAPFMVYGIYKLAQKLFAKEYLLISAPESREGISS